MQPEIFKFPSYQAMAMSNFLCLPRCLSSLMIQRTIPTMVQMMMRRKNFGLQSVVLLKPEGE